MMKRDFKSCMLYALFGLPIFLLLFIATIYFANCGLSTNCSQASLPAIIHTPIPTLAPAAIPTQAAAVPTAARAVCSVTARDLLNTWVSAGYTETQSFTFRDINENICQAAFADVITLFTQLGLWYPGVLACDACHNSDVSIAAAGLDMSSYSGILAGARRTSSVSQGVDILGGGNWGRSILNQQLFVYQLMPFGAPPGALSAAGPTIQAGALVSNPTEAPTEATGQEEVARPHTPGGPGDAINLTGDATAGQKVFSDHCQLCHGEAGTDNVLNPGSDDGTIPPLNPIDSTLVSSDYQTFAYNLDLFLQNGSVAEGPNAAFQMPAWGADGGLTQQQIADVIAYLISLNQ
jgi:mono/diheme cytochrome c family protein